MTGGECSSLQTDFTDCKRRSFLKLMMMVGGSAALAGSGFYSSLGLAKSADSSDNTLEKVNWTSCVVNCGLCCPLRVVSKGDTIVRVETDNTGDGDGQTEARCCVRGRSVRQLVYSPDRLKYPMKRVGKRGELDTNGNPKFERITWDEAFDTIASELKRIIDKYGNESIYRQYGSGTTSSMLYRRGEFFRLINMLGGCLDMYGTYSSAQLSAAMPYTYGSGGGNTLNDIANSKLVVFFGNNAVETRMGGGGGSYDLLNALKKSKAKVVIVDPRYSDTAALFCDEWIPIRPGTDAAMASAIAYVLITENLVDKKFLDTYCIGFDEDTMVKSVPSGNSYKDYILGTGAYDTPKTPEWAAAITGCPADKIIKLAREIGQAKPAFIAQGYGPQRHACGEQSTRAILMLPILTGNVGISGGNSGANEGSWGIPFPPFPTGKNPVKTSIPCFLWYKAIEDGPSMTDLNSGVKNKQKLDVGIKFLWNSSSNSTLNQHSDINATKKILEDDTKCEMIVVVDTRMTPTAHFADIILPSVLPAECDDLYYQGYAMSMGTLVVAPKIIPEPFEAKNMYDICAGIAKRFNLWDEYTENRTSRDWMEFIYSKCREVKPELPENIEEAAKHGIYKWYMEKPKVAFEKFREDPVANPLKTPSGKIEIFSERLWNIGKTWELPEGDVITALPQYTPTWEGATDPLKKEFPLQLIGHHFKGRVHATYANIPWLDRVSPQEVWINPIDAAERGISHGDLVKIYNNRGIIKIPAKITPRIMPGVVSLPQGAWYKANNKGEDIGGCVNTITRAHPSPLAKGNPQHTNLVQISKA